MTTPEEPITLSPLQALSLAAGIWAFGIAFGSYLREGDMKLACDLSHSYTLKGERYACKASGDKRPEPGRARGR